MASCRTIKSLPDRSKMVHGDGFLDHLGISKGTSMLGVKIKHDGTYKARLIARGSRKIKDLDFYEVYADIDFVHKTNPTEIRTKCYSGGPS